MNFVVLFLSGCLWATDWWMGAEVRPYTVQLTLATLCFFVAANELHHWLRR